MSEEVVTYSNWPFQPSSQPQRSQRLETTKRKGLSCFLLKNKQNHSLSGSYAHTRDLNFFSLTKQGK